MTTRKRIAAALIIFAGGAAASAPFYRDAPAPDAAPSATQEQSAGVEKSEDISLRIPAQEPPEPPPSAGTAEKRPSSLAASAAPSDDAPPLPGGPAASDPASGASPANSRANGRFAGSEAAGNLSSGRAAASVPPDVAREFPATEHPPPPVDSVPTIHRPAELTTARRDGEEGDGDGPRVHRLRDGDTLGKLARRFLGDAERWPEIFQFNRDVLKEPEVLPIGVVIRIPPRQATTPAAATQTSASPAAPLTTLVPIE